MLRFAHPEYLNALYLLILFVIVFILMMRWKGKAIESFGDFNIIHKLFPDASKARIISKFVFLMMAYIFVIIGIANPQIGTKLEEVKREGVDIMIALDVSNSMKAEDIRPDRLERAKQAISRLIDKLQNDRIGIIVFAGKAYTQLPITTDYGAAKLFLSVIEPDIVPTQGTAIGEAVSLAVESFPKDNVKNKAVILITDGENTEGDALNAVKLADSAGVIIHTIGMGSPGGGPIPEFYNGAQVGYKKDNAGNTIITKLDEAMLQQIAAAGNGIFVRASNSEDGLKAILNEINKMQKKNYGSKLYTDYEDRFQYFLGIALFFLLLELLISERKSKWLNKLNLFGTQ